MKILKFIALGIIGLLLLLGIGAYVFIKKNFTPDPNYLELSETSNEIPIKWIASKDSPIAALLLPIQFEGIPDTFYLQFDTGSPSSMLFKQSMLSIQKRFPNQISEIEEDAKRIEQGFLLGDMQVFSKKMRLYDKGKPPINWNDSSKIHVVGTLGADIIDKKITMLDFKSGYCYFGDKLPSRISKNLEWHQLKYKNRRTMFPARVGGKKCKLLHDTGTSGFELITNKKTWKKYAKKNAIPREAFKVRSWKRQLTAFNIESDRQIEFEAGKIDLDQVTYIKGASFMQNALMRSTGMGGMIGNQVFMGRILIFNCMEKKYALIHNIP